MILKKILLVFLILFVLSGCIINISTKKPSISGVFISFDKGDNWQSASTLLSSTAAGQNFQNSNLNFLIMDPTDNQALYAGTDDGLYFTYTGAAGWQKTLVGLGNLYDIAIDPKNHCTIYAAINNRLYKSADCSRHWDYTLIEEGNPPEITAIGVDAYNPKNIYVGTIKGGLFKSEDYGVSWHSLKYFNNPIKDIIFTPSDTRIFYIITQSSGIFRRSEIDDSWTDITENLTKASSEGAVDSNCGNFKEYHNLILDPQNDSRLLYATRCLLETTDRGETWKQIKLLTLPAETNILGLAVSYSNNQEIFYGTNTTFYRTVDNGNNWTTKSLPTLKYAAYLLTDPINPTLIYLGLTDFKK